MKKSSDASASLRKWATHAISENVPPAPFCCGTRSADARRMTRLRVAICSTIPPRQCGLATFAADLAQSLESAPGVGEVGIVAMERTSEQGENAMTRVRRATASSPAIIAVVSDEVRATYSGAAKRTNEWADLVVVQHEFGIFGGNDGDLLLEYLGSLDVPYILTLHTVLPHFSSGQLEVLRTACAGASAVTVFTATAKAILLAQHIGDAARIHIVVHGAPAELYGIDRIQAKNALGVQHNFVLSSFGLVSKGKGLELAIEALALVCKVQPNTVLLIAGRTHPEVLRKEGEAYRQSLMVKAAELGVSAQVRFMDGFLRIDEIARLLAATDVFVTPYVNLDQIVSGALTFALAAGCPVVSTPYLYAVDQLSSGAGVVVADRDAAAFARPILGYALNDSRREAAQRSAAAVGADMRWSAVGARMAGLCASLMTRTPPWRNHVGANDSVACEIGSPYDSLPPGPVGTLHLRRLVDDTGVIQHATGIVPLLSSGYCIDDVARLIPVAMALSAFEDGWEVASTRGLAFIADAHRGDGAMLSNFMSWNRTWLDAPHFGDHVGRALAGLSQLPATTEYQTVVAPLVGTILRGWPDQPPLHPDSFALIAQARAPHNADLVVASRMLQRLMDAYRSVQRPGWWWPEERVRYDHVRFPHAMISGGLLTSNDEAVEMGLRSLNWYSNCCDQDTFLRFPGHRGWGPGETLQWSGDEQPLEALAFFEAHLAAASATGDAIHAEFARQAHQWFLGRNRLDLMMVNPDSGACYDGLGATDVNYNCGAESTLAFMATQLQAHDLPRPKQQLMPSSSPRAIAHSYSPTKHTEDHMLTGVKSSVILEMVPDSIVLDEFAARNGCVVNVIDLGDGRVKIESFAPVECENADVVTELRQLSLTQRGDLDALRLS